jgi:hypothetical protein
MSPQILSLIVFAENIHLNLNRPTKIAVCAPGLKLKQSNFERNAKKILGFEHFSLQIRDIEKNCLLNLCKHDMMASLANGFHINSVRAENKEKFSSGIRTDNSRFGLSRPPPYPWGYWAEVGITFYPICTKYFRDNASCLAELAMFLSPNHP